MANSGYIVTNNCGYYSRALRLDWSVQSQSIANNTSTIAWTLSGTGGNTSSWVVSGNFKVIIQGVQRYFSATRINLKNGTVVATGTVTVNHDSAGNCNLSAYCEGGLYTVAVNCSASGSWALPTIPRAASLTSAPNFTDVQNPTIGYSNPAGSAVSSLQACIASSNGAVNYADYRNISVSGSSYTFNLTDAERNAMRQACANSQTLSVKFYLMTTIGGRSYTNTLSRTMTIVDGNPTFSAAYLDTNSTTTAITENDQQLIRNQSTLKINVTNLSAKKYATISSVACAIGGASYTGTISGTSATINVGTLNLSSNTTATVTVTDSRGLATSQNLNLQILDWQLPTALITAERQNHYYSPTTLTVDADYSSLGGKNAVTIKYRYEPIAEQWGSNLYDYSQSFDPHPSSPPSAVDVVLNSDGSLTISGTQEVSGGTYFIVATEDITETVEDGETYIISQTTASSEFFIEVVAMNSTTYAQETYNCNAASSATFVVDKTTYDSYNVIIKCIPDQSLGRYDYFSYTESFSMVKESSGTWSSWATIGDNVPTVVDLDNNYAWDVQVRVSDKIGTTTYNYNVARGMPIVFFDRLKSSVGFNCFPQFENSVEVNGNKVERSAMTRTLAADATNLTANNYGVLNLTNTTTAGSQLIPVAQGGIKIGAGVNKIMVSGKMAIEGSSTTDRRYLRIVLNNVLSSSSTLAWASQTVTVNTIESISITPILVDVNEGDVINLYYYTPKSTDTIKGGFGALTALTVEVVE